MDTEPFISGEGDLGGGEGEGRGGGEDRKESISEKERAWR